jgi:cytochrome o ubiquinol oxidase subunit 3
MSMKEQSLLESTSRKTLGFWIYLMTDCVLFAALFATYAVLHTSTFGGPSGHTLFDPPFVLAETIILLTSSFTIGLAILSSRNSKKNATIIWLCVTFLLGASFLAMEQTEFSSLVSDGNGWGRSAFLSAFFTLVGTHGLHITIGLLWMGVMIYRILSSNMKAIDIRRLALLSLFWHFLDVIWICIFTVVYMMGVA